MAYNPFEECDEIFVNHGVYTDAALQYHITEDKDGYMTLSFEGETIIENTDLPGIMDAIIKDTATCCLQEYEESLIRGATGSSPLAIKLLKKIVERAEDTNTAYQELE